MQIIDKDGILKELVRMKYEDFEGDKRKQRAIDKVITHIKEYPHIVTKNTADAVEVVRCKDCKYLYCISAIDRRFYCRHTPQGLRGINIVEDNPYCSYGERRENDE